MDARVQLSGLCGTDSKSFIQLNVKLQSGNGYLKIKKIPLMLIPFDRCYNAQLQRNS